ncbi:PREDICTED: uncharacterized protein LOC105564777 [Vollenhovia emeryi]|uniref:uncharacterized protein LOC105564777 n=1 Tax=Vollenhovia emeryi TaxID=411798 RepID=UPI0005F3CD02|nr:PREDICTED: uncharacterized protein LOC105564777 [Vollenhovia emeryi]
MLIGISEKIFCSHNSPRTCFVDFLNSFTCNHSRQYHTGVCNLTADYENAHLDIAYLQKDFDKYCITVKRKKVSLKATRNYRQLFHLSFKAYQTNYVKPTQISNKSKKPSCGSFLMLSDEVQLMILKYLDLTSLCCMSQVNRHFNTLTRDSTLYTCLNVRNVRKADYICDIFCYFKSRCKKLQRLDLTSSAFPVGAFVEFLKVCSKRLTHLKLNRCFLRHSYIDYDPVFKIISETCKNLKELDLEFGCAEISNKALLFLKELEGLEYLNLRGTHTEASVLCKILEKNRRIRALHINNVKDIDTVLIELKNFCPDLEILNLHKAHHLTSRGINALAECRNLRKVDLRFNYAGDTADNLRRLLSSCQRLEYIYLSHIFLDDFNLKSLTLGKNLKELHFFWVALDDERPDQFSIIFERCSKLQKLRFYDCNTSDLWINDWKKRYPHVSMLSTSRKDGLSSDIIRLFSS